VSWTFVAVDEIRGGRLRGHKGEEKLERESADELIEGSARTRR
jgi:hypothetical protein